MSTRNHRMKQFFGFYWNKKRTTECVMDLDKHGLG